MTVQAANSREGGARFSSAEPMLGNFKCAFQAGEVLAPLSTQNRSPKNTFFLFCLRLFVLFFFIILADNLGISLSCVYVTKLTAEQKGDQGEERKWDGETDLSMSTHYFSKPSIPPSSPPVHARVSRALRTAHSL